MKRSVPNRYSEHLNAPQQVKHQVKEALAIYRRRGTSKSSVTVSISSSASCRWIAFKTCQSAPSSLSSSQGRCCRRGCSSQASGHFGRRRRVSKAARTVVPVPTTRKHSHNPTVSITSTLVAHRVCMLLHPEAISLQFFSSIFPAYFSTSYSLFFFSCSILYCVLFTCTVRLVLFCSRTLHASTSDALP